MRVAIVGAGRMGRFHSTAAERAGARVVAVVDSDAAAADRLAGSLRPNAAVHRDLPTCLERGDIDVVHVCTPPAVHVGQIQVALDAGVHVLAEKPLAPSPAETRRILDAAQRAGVRLCAVHQFPFQPGVRRILEGRRHLGDLVSLSYRASTAGMPGRNGAERQVLVPEIAPHVWSLFSRFAPALDPQSLVVRSTGDDAAVYAVSGGTHLSAFVSIRGRPPRNELEVVGTHATAFADLFHGFSVVDRGSSGGLGKALRPLRLSSATLIAASTNAVRLAARLEGGYPGLRELVVAFYASVAGTAAPPVTADEMVAAAELAERVRPIV